MEALLYLYILHVFDVVISSSINCPQNETEWIARSKSILCQGSDVYHCLLFEDGKSRKEKCIEKTFILQGHCPIFTKNDYLHWYTCNATGCPDTPFRSDEVYKYPICYGHINEEANDGQNNGFGNQPFTENSNVPLKISIAAIAVLLALALVLFLVWSYRKRKMKCFPGRRNSNEGSEFQPLDPNQSPNPDPNSKEGHDEDVNNGLDILKNKDILYIIGHLGNSVSTTGKNIVKKFADNFKKDNWTYKSWNYLKFSQGPNIESKTVVFIDGWGGLWNENPCEKDLTLETLKRVVELSKSRKDLKFVVGLCSKIRKAYKMELAEIGIQKEGDNILKLDNTSIHKRTIVKRKIKLIKEPCTNEKCACNTLDEEEVSNIVSVDSNVRIGIYLILNLISINHDLIPDLKLNGPLVAMRKHFEELLEYRQTLFWMAHIVCMGYYDDNDLKQEITKAFNISNGVLSIDKDIEKYAKRIDKKELAPMWSSRFLGNPQGSQESNSNSPADQEDYYEEVYVFHHNFLYICAFHAFYKKYPDEIMRVCNIDAILQLVRPGEHSVESFTIQADDKQIDIFCKRIEKFVNDNTWTEHPLIGHWKNHIKNVKE